MYEMIFSQRFILKIKEIIPKRIGQDAWHRADVY